VDQIYPGDKFVIYAPPQSPIRDWSDRQVRKVQRLVIGFAVLAGLLVVAGVAHGGIPTVVMGFHSCDDKNRCTYRELEAPGIVQCLTFGQQAASAWLTENGMQGHTLKRGWKCYINHSPGEEIPV
jgi:hypothetical protein